jgi:hypothetical protein
LAVEADPSTVGIYLLPCERHVLTPPHAAVGDDQDLQLPPPHAGQSGCCRRKFMDGGDRGDLVFGDGPVNRFVRDGGLALPANAAKQVTASHHVSLLETGAHERGERAADVVRDRRRRGQVDDVLEVSAGQLPTRHLGDDREHVLPADPGLLLPVLHRPLGRPRRSPVRVEVVGDEMLALGPVELGRHRATEALDDFVCLLDRRRLVLG